MFNQGTSDPVNAYLTPGHGIYFNTFIHVYSPRAGTNNPLWTNVQMLMSTESLYHFAHLLQVLKQSLHDFFHVSFFFFFFFFFHAFSHVYSPVQGQTNPWGQI